MSDVQQKYTKYLELLPTVQDVYGFIEYHHCDALLFTSLIGCIPEVSVWIEAAQDRKGRWHRRRVDKPCFCDGKDMGSKSSISRDMLLGLLWFCWFNKRQDIAEGVVQYALKNWGVMGEGELSRTWIGPQLLGSFAHCSYKLGGPNRWWLSWIPTLPAGGKKQLPYQRHLEVLLLSIRGQMGMHLSKMDRNSLKAHYEWNPRNPLFSWAVGKKQEALKTLENNTLFPSLKLPAKSDRKAGWLPMLATDEWIGVPEKGTHSGGDLLFCYWLINNVESPL